MVEGETSDEDNTADLVKIEEEENALPEVSKSKNGPPEIKNYQKGPILVDLETSDILCTVENTMRLNLEEVPN